MKKTVVLLMALFLSFPVTVAMTGCGGVETGPAVSDDPAVDPSEEDEEFVAGEEEGAE